MECLKVKGRPAAAIAIPQGTTSHDRPDAACQQWGCVGRLRPRLQHPADRGGLGVPAAALFSMPRRRLAALPGPQPHADKKAEAAVPLVDLPDADTAIDTVADWVGHGIG